MHVSPRRRRGFALAAGILLAATFVVVSPEPATAAPPSAVPNNILVRSDQRSVDVSWPAVANTTDYQIWWRTNGTSVWQWVSSGVGGADSSWVPSSGASSYTEGLLMPASVVGTNIDIAVKACNPSNSCSDPQPGPDNEHRHGRGADGHGRFHHL